MTQQSDTPAPVPPLVQGEMAPAGDIPDSTRFEKAIARTADELYAIAVRDGWPRFNRGEISGAVRKWMAVVVGKLVAEKEAAEKNAESAWAWCKVWENHANDSDAKVRSLTITLAACEKGYYYQSQENDALRAQLAAQQAAATKG